MISKSMISSDFGNGICCICMENKANVIFNPCRHLSMCSDCYTISFSKSRMKRTCPNCRGYITSNEIVKLVD